MVSQGFNCSVACEGIFVDIQWEEEDNLISLAESTHDVGKPKRKVEKKGDLLNRKEFAKLLDEYVAFKRKYVRHIGYDANAESTSYGKETVR